MRRVATRDEIPAEARPLIDRFAEQRLLIRDRRQDAEVIEVAHEALLRQPPFSDWLGEDREFLLWRDRLTQARTAFDADERGLLAGRELAIARSYMQTRAEREFEPADLAFIRDSIAATTSARGGSRTGGEAPVGPTNCSRAATNVAGRHGRAGRGVARRRGGHLAIFPGRSRAARRVGPARSRHGGVARCRAPEESGGRSGA